MSCITNALKKLTRERAHKPVLTCELSRSQVKEFIAVPMIIPTYPADTQGVGGYGEKGYL